jgi:hypothetical protein
MGPISRLQRHVGSIAGPPPWINALDHRLGPMHGAQILRQYPEPISWVNTLIYRGLIANIADVLRLPFAMHISLIIPLRRKQG